MYTGRRTIQLIAYQRKGWMVLSGKCTINALMLMDRVPKGRYIFPEMMIKSWEGQLMLYAFCAVFIGLDEASKLFSFL